VHEEYKTNLKIADKGYWVYDFALPLLVLHAFYFKTAKNLRHWLHICPRRQITVLDTHDGMGIDDIAGLASVRLPFLVFLTKNEEFFKQKECVKKDDWE
jgi:sucrose phosphorylase